MKISSKIGRLCYFIVVLLYCWVSYEFYHSGNTLFENGFEVVCLPLLLFLVSVLILWLITRIGGGKAYNNYFCYSVAALYTFTLLMPFLLIDVPVEWPAPDISYNIGKIWRAYDGHLFVDAVTGYPSIYPSMFHCLWAGVMHIIPVTPHKLLVMSTIFHMMFFMFSTFILVRKLFNTSTAALTVLLTGLIFYLPSIGYITLATNSTFSIGFFILAIYFFYKGYYENPSFLKYSGLLFGFSTVLWPNYLFLLAAMFIVFAISEWRTEKLAAKLAKTAGFYLIPLVYLIVQAVIVAKEGLLGSERVRLFHGVPRPKWWLELVYRFFTLGEDWKFSNKTTLLFTAVYILLFLTACYSLFYKVAYGEPITRRRTVKRFLIILAIGIFGGMFVLNYVFDPSYTRRAAIFLNIIVAGLSANFLIMLISSRSFTRFVGYLIIAFLVIMSVGYNTYKFQKIAAQAQAAYINYMRFNRPVVDAISSLTNKDTRIFSTKEIFRMVIMANIPRYGLVAHRDNNYFYLNSELSAKISRDYDNILSTTDKNTLDSILKKYSIEYCLLSKADIMKYPGLMVMSHSYRELYEDRFFIILKRN